MDNFWNNILRYPRFFFTSLAGLILVILDPFKNLFKIKKFRFILILTIVGLFLLFYKILEKMTGF